LFLAPIFDKEKIMSNLATPSASSAAAWAGKSMVDATITERPYLVVLNNNLGALHSIAGIQATNQRFGDLVDVFNNGASPFTLAALDSAAPAKDQFAVASAVPAGGRVRLYYNGTNWTPSSESGLPTLGAPVVAAAAITPTGKAFHVTGNTAITSMVGTNLAPGEVIRIIFDGTPTFTDGNNLKIAGNLVATADDTISLLWDGSNFYELARAVN
jgi:hypothetical protein